jgi:hypothetical protein
MRRAGIGVSHWINTGKEIGIDAAAALRFADGTDHPGRPRSPVGMDATMAYTRDDGGQA